MKEINWFAAFRKGTNIADYILSGYDGNDALKKLGCLAKGYVLKQLKWRTLSEYTGCLIPENKIGEEFAKGNITFHKITKVVLK